MNTSEVLNRAADLIEERGWEKGIGWVYADSQESDPLCLEGGIQAAMGMRLPSTMAGDTDDSEFASLFACPAYRAVVTYLDREQPIASEPMTCTGFRGQPLYWWNDDAKSATEVIEVLRAAAVIEAAREEQDAAWETYAELVTT